MLKAIIDQLKTGSITTVIPRGSVEVNPTPPYVVVWGPDFIEQPGNENKGKNQYFISAHFPRGFINQLDDYIINEVYDLLHKQILTTRDLRNVRLHVSGGPSNMIEGNADNTISKERVFITCGIYD